ncbi:MAG: class I SAM-dependent methyltransferase [Gaiellaceae bacterium]
MTEPVLQTATAALAEASQSPLSALSLARRWVRPLARRVRVRWGSLRRTSPVSAYYGFDRGLPVDRFYIERFLASFADDVRGRVLEVQDGAYTRRWGGDRVTANEILDINPENAEATLVADLAGAGSLPRERYDCAILTQTLQYVTNPEAALRNMWQSLAPGGVALITVPSLSRIDPDLPPVDFWRFTPRGLETILRQACPTGEIELNGFGNVLAAVAFLMGLAAEELRESELEHNDEDFPLVVCARVRKPA